MSLPASRVEEAEQRFPAYTPLMLLLSLVFVVIALGYAARLLEAMGGSLTPGQLSAMATGGQLLFGSAVALALWGYYALPRMENSGLSWRWRWLFLVTTGIAGMAISLGAQYGLLAAMTHDPSGATGRKAAQITVLSHAALQARLDLGEPGLDLDLLRAASGRAYVTLLLAQRLSDTHVPPPAEARLRDAMQGLMAQRIGTAAQLYDNIFVPSVRSLKDAFNAYVAAQTALVDDIKAMAEQQNRSWNEFTDGLGKRGITLAKLTRTDWPGIANEVRQAGIAVPVDWNPTDRAGYVAALAIQQRRLADAQYAERLNRLFGTALPTGLEWEQFYAHPAVQGRWRQAINAPDEAQLAPTMGFRAFEDTVYRPSIDAAIRGRLEQLTSPVDSYASAGALAALGEAASLRIAIPAVTLLLVLTGLVWHICGMAVYATRLALPRWRWRHRALAAAFGLCGLFVLGARGPVTRGEGFQRMADQIADRAGPAWLAALAAVEMSGILQPGGEALRRTVLANQVFGLDAFAQAGNASPSPLDRLLP